MSGWSTETVKPGERFSYWREVVCQAVLNVATEAPQQRFQARLSGRKFGDLRFAAFASTGHDIVRSMRHTTCFPEDDYLISLQRGGRSLISQGDAAFTLEPGEIAIVDGQKPFHIAFPRPVSRLIAVVPRRALDMRAPWLRKRPHRKIARDAPYADIARRHLLRLAAMEETLHEGEARLLTENLCNLLTLATMQDVPPTVLPPDVQLEAMLAFCRQHLSDPDLSPQRVASRFGVSVRTLHLRFERLGCSFGRWVLENRLDRCGEALRDPLQRASSISEIAYRYGFNDLSHFSKAFRTRFDAAPRQWRQSQNAAQGFSLGA
jgi:AraC-like DNA-binding protein